MKRLTVILLLCVSCSTIQPRLVNIINGQTVRPATVKEERVYRYLPPGDAWLVIGYYRAIWSEGKLQPQQRYISATAEAFVPDLVRVETGQIRRILLPREQPVTVTRMEYQSWFDSPEKIEVLQPTVISPIIWPDKSRPEPLNYIGVIFTFP